MRTVLALLVLLAAALRPSVHGDFGHYTFALTWQPGICSTDGGCLRSQPRAPLIGLHGLWASRPRRLIARGITDPEWWSRGCDYYGDGTAPPPIASHLRSALESVMPHFRHDLLVHEYDKHVRCFGFDPTLFFSTELAMRRAVIESAFGVYLLHHAGRTVTHAAVTRRFASAFATSQRTSLQLQCKRNAAGTMVLTQLWITVRASEIDRFPQSGSLMDALTNQDTCPAEFSIPAWPSK
jgi:ribonuclease I (enterobacter ribonuclease)